MRYASFVLAILWMVGAPAWAQMTSPVQTPLGPTAEPRPATPDEPPALAVQGKIKRLDPWSKTMTLEDGTTLTFPGSAAMSALKEGERVIATYELKNGQKVATSVIRMRPSSRPQSG